MSIKNDKKIKNFIPNIINQSQPVIIYVVFLSMIFILGCYKRTTLSTGEHSFIKTEKNVTSPAAYIAPGTFHVKKYPIKDGESCVASECHEKMIKKKYVHAPVATGTCMACHANIRKSPPFGLVAKGVELCWGCHKKKKIQAVQSKFLHKIIESEGCTSCHLTHNSDQSKYFLKLNEKKLCIDCHKKETPKLIENIETAKVRHKPVDEGVCGDCHDPHMSNFKKLLKKGPDDDQLCFSCHKEKEAQAKKAVYKHGPLKEGLCVPCHEPHGGQTLKNLKFDVDKKFDNPFDPNNSFELRQDNLCVKCHSIDISKKIFPEGAWIHAPSAQGACILCHNPHDSQNKLMLRDNPKELCLKCHGQKDYVSKTFGMEIQAHREKRECLDCHNPHLGKNPSMLHMNHKEKWMEPQKPWLNKNLTVINRHTPVIESSNLFERIVYHVQAKHENTRSNSGSPSPSGQ